MEIVAYTVAPLIHYAPFYTALAALKTQTGCAVTFPECKTDEEVITGAAEQDVNNGERIVLALTSTTDFARDPKRDQAKKILGVLTPLIPRAPLWYVCEYKHRKKMARLLDAAASPHFPSRPLKVACYADGTTSHWVVTSSFPAGAISFDEKTLSFGDDRVSIDRFRQGHCDVAVTLHPWRYQKAIGKTVELLRGPSVAPFGFTAVLFQKSAVKNSGLYDQLLEIYRFIHGEIESLYLCFELAGFDWRRNRTQHTTKPQTANEYIERLNESLSSLKIQTEAYLPQNELEDGLHHLAQSRVWMLPQSALEAKASDSGELESFRNIREKWADEHGELERLEKERDDTTVLVKKLHDASKKELDELANIYLELDPWRYGHQHFDRLHAGIRDHVFSTTEGHYPSKHKDGNVLNEALNDGLRADVLLWIKALKGTRHQFSQEVTTAMFRIWDDADQINKQMQNVRFRDSWQGERNAVSSVCLAYTLRGRNLPLLWVHEILKSRSNCVFKGLDAIGLTETLFPLVQIELPENRKDPVRTIRLTQALKALYTLGSELADVTGEYADTVLGKTLVVKGRLLADTRRGATGLDTLEEKLRAIKKEQDPFDPEAASQQGITRSFWVLHNGKADWQWKRPADGTAALDFTITFSLHSCYEAYEI
jgi:hypothetical protein